MPVSARKSTFNQSFKNDYWYLLDGSMIKIAENLIIIERVCKENWIFLSY